MGDGGGDGDGDGGGGGDVDFMSALVVGLRLNWRGCGIS